MASGVIYDGYTQDEFLKGNEFHPDVRFSFRPLTVDQREEVVGLAGSAKTPEAENLVYRRMIEKYMVSWDLTYPDDHPNPNLRGKVVPCTEPELRWLKYPLWIRLVAIFLGTSHGDLPPDPSPSQADEFESRMKAAFGGQSPGDAVAAADEKNSVTG